MKHRFVQAYLDGSNATPGDTNPHLGQGFAARVWQLAYDKMLVERYESSASYRAYIAAREGPVQADTVATAEQLRQARLEGRRAANRWCDEPRDETPRNAYYGQRGGLAVAWRTGYSEMLRSRVRNGPASRAYLAAQAANN